MVRSRTALHRIQGCGADRRHAWQARLDCLVLSLDRPTPPDVGCRSAPAGRETKKLLRKKENDVKKPLDKESPIQGKMALLSRAFVRKRVISLATTMIVSASSFAVAQNQRDGVSCGQRNADADDGRQAGSVPGGSVPVGKRTCDDENDGRHGRQA